MKSHSVVVSAVTGAGMDELRVALADLCRGLPAPRTDGRVRLWVDRSFTIKGSGTVATGTLGAGTLRVGDQLSLGHRTLTVRGLQSLERAHDAVAAVARVAVNLRGVEVDQLGRGDALVTPGAWRPTETLDVRLAEHARAQDLPRQVTCHIGTAAVTAHMRPLADGAARLTLDRPLPLETGDRLILRDPGHEGAIVGATVADPAPPPLTRRGAGAARGAQVMATTEVALADEVLRRGVLTIAEARLLGHDPEAASPDELLAGGVVRLPGHLMARTEYDACITRLLTAVDEHARTHPIDPHLPMAVARSRSGLPDLPALEHACATAQLVVTRGKMHRPGVAPDLGERQKGVDGIVARLRGNPFSAPEQPDLDAAGLGPREVAAAVATGQLIRIDPDVLLLPTGPAHAMRVLAGLPQPFTTSEARQALGTTRRVAIPLLEHLDARGWTRRTDSQHREVVR